MSIRLLTVLAVVSLSPTVLAAQLSTSGSAADPVLAPGDSVRLTVWRQPELSGDFAIGPDGSMTHPLLRSAHVGGVPLSTAEANIRTALKTLTNDPQFVMEPFFRIAVWGEVIHPQAFAVRPGVTIADAVGRAGGPTETARLDRVRVVRTERNGARREFTINLMQPDRGLASTPTQSGDLIIIERRHNFFREVFIPVLSVAGSIASIGLLIDRNR